MKITGIDCHVLLDPNCDGGACSSAQDDIVVLVHTDAGITGVGEVDTNPWAVEALIKSPTTHSMAQGLEEMLLGRDPMDTEALWEQMYLGTYMAGRRGLGICAIGAVDMALWDIRGKASGLPCWKLFGGSSKERVTPYASLLPTGDTVKEQNRSLVAKVKQAQSVGFHAAKLEVILMGPFAHNRVVGTNEDAAEMVAACREAVGSDFVLMVDVGYSWKDAREACRAIEAIAPYMPYMVETPLLTDDLEGYAYLHDHSPIPIAAGEMQNGRFEFMELMDRAKLDIVQPDVGRVGGLTEAMRVCELAAGRGRRVIPHSWKTLIGIMASVHLSAATSNCPYVEFLPAQLSESTLRRELVLNEPLLEDGKLKLPTAPGFGNRTESGSTRSLPCW